MRRNVGRTSGKIRAVQKVWVIGKLGSRWSKIAQSRKGNMSAGNRRPGDRVVHVPRSDALQPGGGRDWTRAAFLRDVLVPHRTGVESKQARLLKFLVVVAVLALTTWALLPVRETIGLLNIGLIYLVVVIGATLWAGQWTG